jgi:hypothetical protein
MQFYACCKNTVKKWVSGGAFSLLPTNVLLNKKPGIIPGFRVDDGARTHDPQNHNLML